MWLSWTPTDKRQIINDNRNGPFITVIFVFCRDIGIRLPFLSETNMPAYRVSDVGFFPEINVGGSVFQKLKTSFVRYAVGFSDFLMNLF